MGNIILTIIKVIIISLGFVFTVAMLFAIDSEIKYKNYFIHPFGVKIWKDKEK